MLKLKGLLKLKEGEIEGIASTELPDRDGDVIKQNGWDLKSYKTNPVILVSHNYQEFPIGWMNFPKPGKYQVSVSCLEGDSGSII